MPRWIPILLAIIVALLVVVLVAVPRVVESKAERLLSTDAFEATIGDVSLRPIGAVVALKDVRVVDRKTGKIVVEVPAARIDTAPTALLRGQLRVSQVDAAGASLNLAVAPARTEQWLDQLRKRLVELPKVTIAKVKVRDSSATVITRELGRPVGLEPVEMEANDIRNRPAAKGDLPTTAWITATVPPGGIARIELKTDLFSPRSDFDLRMRGNGLPLRKGSKVVEKRAGIEAEGGQANVAIDAHLRDGTFEGSASTSARKVELGGDSVAEDIVAGVAEAGADVAGSLGLAKRTVKFEGTLHDKRATLQQALTQVVDDAISELASLPG